MLELQRPSFCEHIDPPRKVPLIIKRNKTLINLKFTNNITHYKDMSKIRLQQANYNGHYLRKYDDTDYVLIINELILGCKL